MQPAVSIREVGEAVNRARTGASEYCTNFFPSPQKLQGWIDHGELLCDERAGVPFFLRKDRGFWHLYFCAANPATLQRAIAALPILGTDHIVLDLVGTEAELAGLIALFEASGWRIHNRLFRMARTASVAASSAPSTPDPRVVVADRADVPAILDLLLRSFDCRAEQIPMFYEVEAAAAAGQIWVARRAGGRAGLLFFETRGFSSLLRYWLVAPEFRTQRLGSALMHRYLAEHPAVRRFLLWVVASNPEAIVKYEHFGFAREGMVDYVFANDRIRS